MCAARVREPLVPTHEPSLSHAQTTNTPVLAVVSPFTGQIETIARGQACAATQGINLLYDNVISCRGGPTLVIGRLMQTPPPPPPVIPAAPAMKLFFPQFMSLFIPANKDVASIIHPSCFPLNSPFLFTLARPLSLSPLSPPPPNSTLTHYFSLTVLSDPIPPFPPLP